jgi:hypothetical protein
MFSVIQLPTQLEGDLPESYAWLLICAVIAMFGLAVAAVRKSFSWGVERFHTLDQQLLKRTEKDDERMLEMGEIMARTAQILEQIPDVLRSHQDQMMRVSGKLAATEKAFADSMNACRSTHRDLERLVGKSGSERSGGTKK